MAFSKALLAASLALTAFCAQATTYNLSGLNAGAIQNPGSFTATVFASAADANATLDFVLKGYLSLDGYNSYEDRLTLTVNGTQVQSGSFNLGGGGTSDLTFGGAPAVTVDQNNNNPGTGIGWLGGTTTVTGMQFSLLQGTNTFLFAYSAPGASNGGGQGLGDEGWGITSATVHAVTAVPEPETYAMLLAGLGLIGTIARRRSQSKSA